MNNFISYGKQEISRDDIKAVVNVLQSSHLTQGEAVPGFESSFATRVRSRFAIATNSATSALHITCLGLGLGPGDILWTSPISFVASANCGVYCGAKVDFVDVNPETGRMCPNRLKEKLEKAANAGSLPKIVIPVHLGGNSCEMRAIKTLGDQYGFKIIEDASHAVGASYQTKPVGNCFYSDAVVFSFHPVKIITSGEGGMVTTNNEELAAVLEMLRSHGITRDTGKLLNHQDGGWYYEQQLLGLNYRLSDIHAALGNSQLKQLDHFIGRRRELVSIYNSQLEDLPVGLPDEEELTTSSWHLYAIRVRSGESFSRRQLYNELHKKNIGVNVHYIPIYRQPYFADLNVDPDDFPGAETYYESTLTLPLHPGLSEEQVGWISEEVRTAVELNHHGS